MANAIFHESLYFDKHSFLRCSTCDELIGDGTTNTLYDCIQTSECELTLDGCIKIGVGHAHKNRKEHI